MYNIRNDLHFDSLQQKNKKKKKTEFLTNSRVKNLVYFTNVSAVCGKIIVHSENRKNSQMWIMPRGVPGARNDPCSFHRVCIISKCFKLCPLTERELSSQSLQFYSTNNTTLIILSDNCLNTHVTAVLSLSVYQRHLNLHKFSGVSIIQRSR
jgi:hypothetical protein